MVDLVKRALLGQFEAALAMLNEAIVKCPEAHWDGTIAKYPFWQAAYHTLSFVDCYLSPSNEAFAAELQERAERGLTGAGLHPMGMKELDEEYPSRRFERGELLGYVELCLGKLRATLEAETAESLAGPSGFSWLRFSRLEAHIYNLRHVQHHAGQLGAFVRKAGVDVGWVGTGWRGPK